MCNCAAASWLGTVDSREEFIDAGRGVKFRGPWLVVTKDGGRLRSVAPWIQTLIGSTWDIFLSVGEYVLRCNRRDPRWAIFVASYLTIWWAILHVDPLVLLLLGGPAGLALGGAYVAWDNYNGKVPA